MKGLAITLLAAALGWCLGVIYIVAWSAWIWRRHELEEPDWRRDMGYL